MGALVPPFFIKTYMETDQYYIKQTFELANKGAATVSPNPLVGALIVKNGKIIGTGYHSYSGGPHAEIVAIENCSEDPTGATLYCNLEPCCHKNKMTPPCTPAILRAGIKKVVISNYDSNSNVSGRGINELRQNNIEVVTKILEIEGLELNRIFFKYIKTNIPYVTVKVAQTLDGKICLDNGSSKWISNSTSRNNVHELRLSHDAICVGINTVLNDNPFLNVRNESGDVLKSPYKIIIGNPNKLFKDLNILKLFPEKTIVFYHSHKVSAEKQKSLGVELVKIPKDNFEVNILKNLGERKITSVFIEGGEKTISSFLLKRIVDKLIIYIAPKLFGQGKSFYCAENSKYILDNFTLHRLENMAGDIMSEYNSML